MANISEAPPPMVMPSMLDLLSWQNPVFRQYGFWTAVLVFKMGLMSFITIVQRYRTKVGGSVIPTNVSDF